MSNSISISRNGEAVAAIYYTEARYERAANILKDYLGKVTGGAFACKQGYPDGEGDIVFLNDSLGDAGFALRTGNGRLVIAAGNGRAAVFAVYDLLEKYAGCRYYTSSVEKIPFEPDLTFSLANETVTPILEYRELYYQGYVDAVFAEKHKLSPSRSHEGWGFWCHSFAKLLPPDLFDEHPEYFSMIDGERTRGSQPCLSNPKVYETIRDNLNGFIKKNPEAKYWSVSQDDHAKYCRCPECQALDDIDGGPMGSLLTFINKIAKDFPEKIISTLAYWYSRKPPKVTRPAPNVHIMLCNIEANRGRPIKDDPKNEGSKLELLDWAGICGKVFLWDYGVQFNNLVSPFPNLRVLGPNIRFFTENNVRYLFSQCNREVGGEFSELRGYMLAKLMWNPYLDERAVMTDFLDGYYGGAGKYILEYIDILHDEQERHDKKLDIFNGPKDAKETYLTPELFKCYMSLFDKAEDAVYSDAAVLARVRTARMPLYYAGIVNRYEDKEKLLDKFASLAEASGLKMVKEHDGDIAEFIKENICCKKG